MVKQIDYLSLEFKSGNTFSCALEHLLKNNAKEVLVEVPEKISSFVNSERGMQFLTMYKNNSKGNDNYLTDFLESVKKAGITIQGISPEVELDKFINEFIKKEYKGNQKSLDAYRFIREDYMGDKILKYLKNHDKVYVAVLDVHAAGISARIEKQYSDIQQNIIGSDLRKKV